MASWPSMAKRVADRRILRLIRGFLTAGVLVDGPPRPAGRVSFGDRIEGLLAFDGRTDGRRDSAPVGLRGPHGPAECGPLSPLLSNLMLDVLDKELTRRGHRYVRYADDCNIYVCSRRAGEQVMTSVTSFLNRRLELQVNTAKSAVDRPSRRKFLGFSFTAGKAPPRRRIAPQALARFKTRVRALTRWTKGASLEQTIEGLRICLTGWVGYFGFCQTPSVLHELHQWLRRRLRAFAWKQWRNGWNRFRQLSKRGVLRRLAAQTAGSVHGPLRGLLTAFASRIG